MAKIRTITRRGANWQEPIQDACQLSSDYERMWSTHRATLRQILQRAYAATTFLFDDRKMWRAFVKADAWTESGVERPDIKDQPNAQLHFLRLMLRATQGRKDRRDKAGKYARALDILRAEGCSADDVAAELKKRTIEKLARAMPQNDGASREEDSGETQSGTPAELRNPVSGGLLMSAKTDRALRQMDGRRASITADIEVTDDFVIITASSVRAAR